MSINKLHKGKKMQFEKQYKYTPLHYDMIHYDIIHDATNNVINDMINYTVQDKINYPKYIMEYYYLSMYSSFYSYLYI